MKTLWLCLGLTMVTLVLLWQPVDCRPTRLDTVGQAADGAADQAGETMDKRGPAWQRDRNRGYQHMYDPYPFDFRGFYWISE